MKATIRLFLVLITIVVGVLAWITGQIREERILLLIVVLAGTTMTVFLVQNLLEHREDKKKREARESAPGERSGPDGKPESPHASGATRSKAMYSWREKKSGLTWGGGNIKASEATRGTKRKYLGR
jgi:hypothetical protein